MSEGNVSLKFRSEKIDESRNYFLGKMQQII